MTAEWPAKDSRDYIVAFELNSTNHCPADFELPLPRPASIRGSSCRAAIAIRASFY
jgi:hypothetical protein